MCTTCLVLRNSALCHTLYLCFFFSCGMLSPWISNISLAAFFLMGVERVFCDVRTSVLCITYMKASITNSQNTIHFVSFLFIFLFFWRWGCSWVCLLELRPLMDPLYTCWLIDKWIWNFGGMMIDKAKVKLINKSILVSLCEKLSRDTGAETDPSRWLTTWAVAQSLFSFVMEERR